MAIDLVAKDALLERTEAMLRTSLPDVQSGAVVGVRTKLAESPAETGRKLVAGVSRVVTESLLGASASQRRAVIDKVGDSMGSHTRLGVRLLRVPSHDTGAELSRLCESLGEPAVVVQLDGSSWLATLAPVEDGDV